MKNAITILVVLLITTSLRAENNWPQWRGPAGTGSTPAVASVTTWNRQTNIRWKIDLPQPGNSTPAVAGEKIFLTQAFGDDERGLMCFARDTGEELWRRTIRYGVHEATHRTNPYCSASPAADSERVIAWLGSAGLICWDHSGNEQWRRDLGVQRHQWGYGSSPIIYQDLCILNFGPGDNEFLIAVDVRTGETAWKIDSLWDERERELSGPENDGGASDFSRNSERSERLRGSWSTPIIAKISGKEQLIATLPRRVAAFDPSSGQQLWVCGGGAPLAYASPMESDGVVVALGGYRGASLAVRASGKGNITHKQRLWHEPSDAGWLGTGIIHDGAVYAADMGGVLRCRDIETGETLWQARTKGGSTWSSITQDGNGTMFLMSQSGATTVFRPNKNEFDVVAINDLGESTNASVIIAGTDLLIRTNVSLWSITSK